MLRSLENEPARLFGAICREYAETNEPVPDHHLNLTGYFGETILRALVSADMVTREAGDRYFLYSYKPTESGLRYFRAMAEENRV